MNGVWSGEESVHHGTLLDAPLPVPFGLEVEKLATEDSGTWKQASKYIRAWVSAGGDPAEIIDLCADQHPSLRALVTVADTLICCVNEKIHISKKWLSLARAFFNALIEEPCTDKKSSSTVLKIYTNLLKYKIPLRGVSIPDYHPSVNRSHVNNYSKTRSDREKVIIDDGKGSKSVDPVGRTYSSRSLKCPEDMKDSCSRNGPSQEVFSKLRPIDPSASSSSRTSDIYLYKGGLVIETLLSHIHDAILVSDDRSWIHIELQAFVIFNKCLASKRNHNPAEYSLVAAACTLVALKSNSEYIAGPLLYYDLIFKTYNSCIDKIPELSSKLGYKGTGEGILAYEIYILQFVINFDFHIDTPVAESTLKTFSRRFGLSDHQENELVKILVDRAYKFSNSCLKYSVESILSAALKIVAKKNDYKIEFDMTKVEAENVDKLVKYLGHLKYIRLKKMEEDVFGVWGFCGRRSSSAADVMVQDQIKSSSFERSTSRKKRSQYLVREDIGDGSGDLVRKQSGVATQEERK